MTAGKPFAGVRVLEVAARTFVPAAGAVLADLGADVIKVEPPTGDPQRGLTNMLQMGVGSANPFIEIPNRGKRSITLDLASEAGHALLLELAKTCDVFMTSTLPAVRTKLRYDLADIRAANPDIIYVRGHGWGDRGPMRNTGGFDLAAAWATSAMAFKMTRPGEEPMFQPPAFYDLQGSNAIAGAVGAALYQREKTGEATDVDVSLMSVGIWSMSPDVMAGPSVGSIPPPNSKSAPNPITNVYGTADDRWLYLVCLQSDRYWDELCALIDRKDLAADQRFAGMALRAQNAVACVEQLAATFKQKTLAEWQEALATFTGVWSPVMTPAEIHEHVQVNENGFLPEVTANDGSTFRIPIAPAQFGQAPAVPRGPAPELGQHTEEILLELGKDWDVIGELRASGALG